MKGGKPTPTALKILRGNPGKRPLNRHEAKPQAPPTIAAPSWLTPIARAEWEDKAPMLYRLGLLTEADVDAFAMYCATFARWKDAEARVMQSGLLIKSGSNNGIPTVNPYLSIANRAQKEAMRMLVEFGLTPSARTRIKVEKPSTGDKFSRFEKATRA